jgi:hypothetical protein
MVQIVPLIMISPYIIQCFSQIKKIQTDANVYIMINYIKKDNEK